MAHFSFTVPGLKVFEIWETVSISAHLPFGAASFSGVAESATEHGNPALKVGTRDGDYDDRGGDQLQHGGRHVEPQRDCIHQTEDEGAQHHTDGALRNAPTAHEGATDQETGKGNRHHASADVDVHGLLGLGQKATGKGGEGVRHTEADGGGEGRVDGRGAHHVGVVARGADGETETRAQKEREEDDHQDDGDECDEKFILPGESGALQEGLRLGEYGLGLVHVQQGGIAHDGDVDGVEGCVHDDAGKKALHTHPGLEKSRDKAGDDSGTHGGRKGQPWVPGDRDNSTHAGAEGEAAVRGQVADIQHRVAQEQRKYGQGVNEPEFERGLTEAESSGESHGKKSF